MDAFVYCRLPSQARQEHLLSMQEIWRVLRSEDLVDAETCADRAWQKGTYTALAAYLAAPDRAPSPYDQALDAHLPAQLPGQPVGAAATAAPDRARAAEDPEPCRRPAGHVVISRLML